MSNIQITYGKDSFSYSIALIKLNVPDIKTPVAFRPETTDVPAFIQIFIAKSYELSAKIPVQLIIDGGANVGYASVWFANQFPGAEIVAIEPEGENFAILRENTWYYPDIRLIQAAIWNKPGEVNLVTHDAANAWLGHWALRVEEVAGVAKRGVKAVTIDEILRGTGRSHIDILKLDIEGAEKEVFSDNYASWLSRTNILILELHDRFKAGCREAVYSAVRNFDFTEYQRGENTFFFRKAPLLE
jgi:FkbM family methyltransferase